jgi:hypothetical protein
MSRFRFELAGPSDDGDLRAILAQTPMAGHISVAFRREPDYFAGSVVDGRFRQVIVCRDSDSGRVIGFGTRSVMERWVNGKPVAIGYLGGLRVLADYRNQGLVARGYAFLRQLHRDGRTPLYLTTIAEGNAVALDVLTSGRAGLPRYHFAGQCHTLALPPLRRLPALSTGLHVRQARREDEREIIAFLQRAGPRRQFFPFYQEGDLFAQGGIFKDLAPADVWLAWRGPDLVGVLGAWDQHAYKQSVVHAYSGLLGMLRPVHNAVAWMTGRPPLPPPGQPFRYRTAALVVTAGDDPDVFLALTERARHSLFGGPDGYLMLGLHEADPLWPVARSQRGAQRYTTRLYLACWEDGEALRGVLDGRAPYLELGCL